MISKYDIGDTVILTGTVEQVEQGPDGRIHYTLKEYRVPIKEETILARIEEPWRVLKLKTE